MLDPIGNDHQVFGKFLHESLSHSRLLIIEFGLSHSISFDQLSLPYLEILIVLKVTFRIKYNFIPSCKMSIHFNFFQLVF
jgi:hypothetical protein